MKLNLIVMMVTFVAVFLAVGIPYYNKVRAMGELATVPPGSAFVVTAIFAAGVAFAAFIGSVLMQRFGYGL